MLAPVVISMGASSRILIIDEEGDSGVKVGNVISTHHTVDILHNAVRCK